MTPTITPEAARLAELRGVVCAFMLTLMDDYSADDINAAFAGIGYRRKQDAAPTSAVPAGFWLAPMEPDAEMFDAAKYDESFIEAWDDMRNAYLARNPGACSVTDGEAKK